jgi:putative flippase GtrA
MFFRFLLVGGAGFFIDAGLTYLLVLLEVEPWLARVPAIIFAMSFTWLSNRHFTYQVKTSRSTSEAVRYALVAITMALIN